MSRLSCGSPARVRNLNRNLFHGSGQKLEAGPKRNPLELLRRMVTTVGKSTPLVPPEIAITLPNELLRLMGYDRAGRRYGIAIDRNADPLEVMRTNKRIG